MSFLNGKKFSPKNFREALDNAIERLSNTPWTPDYTHHSDRESANHYEAESRARLEGEIQALKTLRENPLPPTKSEVRELLIQMMDEIQKKEGFTRQTGWNQVNRKGIEKNKAYGQFHRLDLLYSFL